MDSNRDKDLPPSSVASPSLEDEEMSLDANGGMSGAEETSTGPTVCLPGYRGENLFQNGISVQLPTTNFPEHISKHVQEMTTLSSSHEQSPKQMSADYQKLWIEIYKGGNRVIDLARLFDRVVFPDLYDGIGRGLSRESSALMSIPLIPAEPNATSIVSQPMPDTLYGYYGRDVGIFSAQQLQKSKFLSATINNLRFPFLVVELKAAMGKRGTDLLVAGNQCAGALAACLSAIDGLNSSLPDSERVDNIAYGIGADIIWRNYLRRG